MISLKFKALVFSLAVFAAAGFAKRVLADDSVPEIRFENHRFTPQTLTVPAGQPLTIKVVNAWVNRLIGDEQPAATKYTFADVKPYKADSPLQSSGLLGPVRVYSAATVQ